MSAAGSASKYVYIQAIKTCTHVPKTDVYASPPSQRSMPITRAGWKIRDISGMVIVPYYVQRDVSLRERERYLTEVGPEFLG